MNLTNNISEDVSSNVKIVASPEARTVMCCDYFFSDPKPQCRRMRDVTGREKELKMLVPGKVYEKTDSS